MAFVELTPVQQLPGGMHVKRDDLYHLGQHPEGGGKLRQCLWLCQQMVQDGRTTVVTAASVQSPQHAMTAIAASATGLRSVHIVGATTQATAQRWPSIAKALDLGGELVIAKAGYNTVLQYHARQYATQHPEAAILHWGAQTAPDADLSTVRAFHLSQSVQTTNLPDQIETVVLPVGSGVSTVSVMLGLWQQRRHHQTALHLVFVGANRWDWIANRLESLDIPPARFHVTMADMGRSVPYSKQQPYCLDGIDLHPTYEGKVAAWCDSHPPQGWRDSDGKALFWVVGSPLGPPSRPKRPD